jgi:hypothetical protein
LFADERKDEIRAACLEVASAVVFSKSLFRFLEQLEITGWDAANPTGFPVLDLDELRRHTHRRHADDDVETSLVADDCSDFEHGRTRTPQGAQPHHRQLDRPRRSLGSRERPALASLEWAVGREDEASGGLLYLWSIRGCMSGERLGL